MPKYIITWSAGFGEESALVEAESLDDAGRMAHRVWRDESENQARYEALEYNSENCEEYDIDFED